MHAPHGQRAGRSRIRVGIGGWTFEPWRDNFYPKGLPHARELHYASRQLTAIEVNGTYYSTMKPATFAQVARRNTGWLRVLAQGQPLRHQSQVLATAGESIQRFVASGIARAAATSSGPILWQFMPTKKFDPADFEAFLKLLPREAAGRPLRHVLDVRHESFATRRVPGARARATAARRCTPIRTSSRPSPMRDSDLAYLRLMRSDAGLRHRLPAELLDQWAQGCRAWAAERIAARGFLLFHQRREGTRAGGGEARRQLDRSGR